MKCLFLWPRGESVVPADTSQSECDFTSQSVKFAPLQYSSCVSCLLTLLTAPDPAGAATAHLVLLVGRSVSLRQPRGLPRSLQREHKHDTTLSTAAGVKHQVLPERLVSGGSGTERPGAARREGMGGVGAGRSVASH